MNGVRTPREDDNLGVVGYDGFKRRGARNTQGEDVEGADAASNEMGVLGSVI